MKRTIPAARGEEFFSIKALKFKDACLATLFPTACEDVLKLWHEINEETKTINK